VQAQIVLGRYYYRLPHLLRDLKKAELWLQESIKEAGRNPKYPPDTFVPIMPRLFLMEVFLQKGGQTEEIKGLFTEVEELLQKPLNHYENHLKSYMQYKLRSDPIFNPLKAEYRP